ncbi:uncharacterized protein LOC117176749 [Belonocnema kinseyi]|uniref:uncharacterized protein LOC117176749 n=1 Tax=Belonocnema kinseyi TaxID=2817044 RepID=UPI00143DB2D2|nr:uncharacterized protein LOC117176749 [Belonocnema kinseyi]
MQGHPPIKERYRVVSPKIQEAMYAEVDRMLAEGVIKEFSREWSAPIVMAKKGDGGYRLCLDFRRLNAISKNDLSAAFNQIPLDESCQEFSAFVVPGRRLFTPEMRPNAFSFCVG